jgi:hypothetical protein
LLELLANSFGDFLEEEGKRLVVLVSTDVLSELLVNLLNDLGAPALNLVLY